MNSPEYHWKSTRKLRIVAIKGTSTWLPSITARDFTSHKAHPSLNPSSCSYYLQSYSPYTATLTYNGFMRCTPIEPHSKFLAYTFSKCHSVHGGMELSRCGQETGLTVVHGAGLVKTPTFVNKTLSRMFASSLGPRVLLQVEEWFSRGNKQ